MKNNNIIVIITLLLGCLILTGCNKDKHSTGSEKDTQREIIIGFSQLGAESDWRNANTKSMKEAFSKSSGYELIVEDGQQKQSNQIMAIRTFIQQEVDYIVLAPVTETGWDSVLQEAKSAGIPVIIVDRMIDVEDDSLFTCWIGSDFELEGRKMTQWLEQYIVQKKIPPEELNIVNIQGTIGSSSQIGRTKALRRAAEENGWRILAEVTGDYTQAKAREVMHELLEKYEDVNVVYCENDNEAFGAIEAIEAAGLKVGSDITNGEIMVLSFDGVTENALNYVREDRITCIAECNALHGPRVHAIIDLMEAGGTPDKFSYVEEKFFSSNSDITQITLDEKHYEVTLTN